MNENTLILTEEQFNDLSLLGRNWEGFGKKRIYLNVDKLGFTMVSLKMAVAKFGL